MVRSSDILAHIIATDATFLETDSKAIGAMFFKASVRSDIRMTQQTDTEARNVQNLRLD